MAQIRKYITNRIRERVIFGAEPMTTINIYGHCSEDGSNLVERLLWERSWDGSGRKRIEKKPWTGPRQTGRHVYVTLERTLIKMGSDHALKVRTFDNKKNEPLI